MLASSKDPAVLAQPGSGFRFPDRKSFSPDRETSELRLLIAGWLKQAEIAVTSNAGGIQELRDAAFRASELVVALSARELAILQIQQERQRHEVNGQTKAEAPSTPRPRARKEKAAAVPAESIRAEEESA